MGEMKQFRGGESGWVGWKFRFLNAVGKPENEAGDGVRGEEKPSRARESDLRGSDPEARGAAGHEGRSGGGAGEGAPEVQPAHDVADDARVHGVHVPEGGEGV